MECNSNAAIPAELRLCTFCNKPTNGYEKWLFARSQDKGPFFPVLSEIRGDSAWCDDLGRALVCVACFHHLLRQWSSFERRGIPLKKRDYLLIPGERVSSFQLRKEDEIRHEAERKLREIQQQEEKIKRDAEIRLALYRQREQRIKEEAQRRILEDRREVEEIEQQAAEQLKGQQEKEEELKRLLERQLEEEKEKKEYIRREAERLLREERLIAEPGNKSTSISIQSPQGWIFEDINIDPDDPESVAKMQRQRTMEYDAESGCYRRVVPLDFEDKHIEDVVATKIRKSESDEPPWRQPETKERGSRPDDPLEDAFVERGGDNKPPVYVSGGLIRTEYKFSVSQEATVESTPDSEFNDDDIRRAGEAMKAKFQEDRQRFQQEGDVEGIVFSEKSPSSTERRRSSGGDTDINEKKTRSLSLEKRLRGMEERRARLFGRNPESMENKENIEITKSEKTQEAPENTTEKDDSKKRSRNRSERNKRRLDAEMIVPRVSGGEEDNRTSHGVRGTGDVMVTKKISDHPRDKESSKMGTWWSDEYEAGDITFTVKETSKEKDSNVGEDLLTFDDVGTTQSEPQEESSEESEEEEEDEIAKRKLVEEMTLTTEEHPKQELHITPEYFTKSEPDDIVFTVKTTTQTKNYDVQESPESSDEEPQNRSRGILQREGSAPDSEFDPKLVEWEIKNAKKDKPEVTSKEDEPAREPTTGSSGVSVEIKREIEVTRREVRKRQDKVDSGTKRIDIEMSVSKQYIPAVESAPLHSTPAEDGATIEHALESAPVKYTPVESAPVKYTPVESAPVKYTPVESAPVKYTPVESAPVNMEIVESEQEESIRSTQPLISQLQDNKSINEERKRKRQEMEEKKRRIMENQKRASLRRGNGSEDDRQSSPEPTLNRGPPSHDEFAAEDLKEKRRSLLLMWEAKAESNGIDEPRPYKEPEVFGYTLNNAVESQPELGQNRSENIVDYRTMDVDDDNDEARTPFVDVDEHHKLNDEELRWESAGQFQPSKLKSMFHEMDSEEPATIEYTVVRRTKTTETQKNWGGQPEVNRNNYETEDVMSAPLQEDEGFVIESTTTEEVRSEPKPLWDESDAQGAVDDSDDDAVDGHKPHVDVDESHFLTQEERMWDGWTGQGNPRKLKSSLFEGFQIDQSSDSTQKIKKGESSKYEVITKMQRSDSKKKLLVPTKLEVEVSEQKIDEEENEPRACVNKLDKPVLMEKDVEEERRRLEEERRLCEKEEMEREREAERRRIERESMEQDQEPEEVIDDEYEARVRSQRVGKINSSMFEQFQRNGEPESTSVPRTRIKSREEPGKLFKDREVVTETTEVCSVNTVESSPFDEPEVNGMEPAEEEIYERRIRDKAVGKLDLGLFARTENEDTDQVNQDVSSVRNVKKLDLSRFSFTSDNEQQLKPLVPKGAPKKDNPLEEVDDRKLKRAQEEKEWDEAFREEREQIELMKRAQDAELDVDIVNNNDVDTNNCELSRNVGKLDNNLFSKFQQSKEEEVPVKKEVYKREVKREAPPQPEQDVIVMHAQTQVESTPIEYDYNTDEYEIKRQSVGKLKIDWMAKAQEQEAQLVEQKRRENEAERIRAEKEEMERLKREQRAEQEQDVFDGRTDERTIFVKRLSKESMSQFEQEEPTRQSPSPRRKISPALKEEKRQERRLARKESRTKMYEEDEGFIIEEKTSTIVESKPEGILYEEPKKEVGRIRSDLYVRDNSEESDSKKRSMEQERAKQELEEIQRLRDEEARRKKSDSSDDEDGAPITDKPQSVNKLDLSQFRQFQKEPEPEPVPRKLSVKRQQHVSPPKEEQSEEVLVTIETRQEVESAPPQEFETWRDDTLEKEREEAMSYDERIKKVQKLDVNKIIQQRQEEERESQRKARLLEEQRLLEERAEMERAKRELEERKAARYHEPQEEEEDEEDAVNVSPEKPQNVRKLDLSQFSKFQRAAEPTPQKPPRKISQKETPPKEDRQVLETEIITIETRHEVESAPPVGPESIDMIEKEREEALSYDEKIKKEVKPLDVQKIIKQRQEEQRESQRRARLLEEQRLREEREEMERARRELEEKNRLAERENLNMEYSENERAMESDKFQNVNRLDLSQFSQYQKNGKEEAVSRPAGKQRPKNEITASIENGQSTDEDIVVTMETRQEVESTPPGKIDIIEKEREEAFYYDEKIKKEVKPLDVQKIIQQRHEEQRESQRRARLLEEQRLREEREEMERAKEELKRSRQHQEISAPEPERTASESSDSVKDSPRTRGSSSEVIQVSSVTEVESEAPISYENEERPTPQKETKSVGRLNLEMYSEAFSKEAKEAERRKRELERQRALREREEMEQLRREQEAQSRVLHEPIETTQDKGERVPVNGQESSARINEQERGGVESSTVQNARIPDEGKPTPKRLDLSKFSLFEPGEPVVVRQKGDRNARPVSTGGAELQMWQDDTMVRRREKPAEGRRARPKSIAGTTLQSESAISAAREKRVFIID
ncbi:trichohyalin isoform X2 [Nematostella vectensis]|uniref:trichohyalin isoform X2 n=1 Tax=Nematostella vectensis TaxID=45351 RepID=UPI0020772C22|nr:trichohyalin isoform X2 [Nematostella vectensis]